jgi:type II secretory pathway pseudopilin PulG
MPRRCQYRFTRCGFTLIEAGVGLAIIAAAMVLVMQVGYWSLRCRSQTAARFLATELAANVLAQADAVPWEDLNDDWAKAHFVSDEVAEQLSQATLQVKVERMEGRRFIKRISVEVAWTISDDAQPTSVLLIGLFSQRTAASGDSN